MKLELLTANNIDELIDFINKKNINFYINQKTKKELLNDITELRNFLFAGYIICIVQRNKNGLIEKLMIVEKRSIYSENENHLKCHGFSTDKTFVKEAFEILKDLIDYPNLRKIKLFCTGNSKEDINIDILMSFGFEVEIEYDLGDEYCYELALFFN